MAEVSLYIPNPSQVLNCELRSHSQDGDFELRSQSQPVELPLISSNHYTRDRPWTLNHTANDADCLKVNPSRMEHSDPSNQEDTLTSRIVSKILSSTLFPTFQEQCVCSNSSNENEALWKLYTKAKDALPNGTRMENLTWRLMALCVQSKDSFIAFSNKDSSASRNLSHPFDLDGVMCTVNEGREQEVCGNNQNSSQLKLDKISKNRAIYLPSKGSRHDEETNLEYSNGGTHYFLVRLSICIRLQLTSAR
jgi:hypothetical protein